jgi:pyruvate formate lyase activating enzyme
VRKVENDRKISGISISFNEPTLSLEYALDVFNRCKPETYRMFVTNGYMTPHALECLINAGMTGMSITVKGDADTVKNYCKTDIEKVWENIKHASDKKVHVEIIYLTIPTVNDITAFFRQVASRLSEINKDTPLHFTQFHPDYQFTHVDMTPIDTLEKAHKIAKSEGIRYVYLGNVPGHPLENTYCSNCQKLLIKRTGYNIEKKFDVRTGRCPFCSTKIPLFLS